MRKVLPFVLAGLAGLFILLALLPKPQGQVVTAVVDLPAGHPLTAEDLQTLSLPETIIPQGAFTDPAPLIGQVLAVPRSAGDVLTAQHLGQPVTLAPDERAIAVRVSDATGLAGLLKPGQQVGVTAVMVDRNDANAFAKATLGGLRVLYLPPDFRAQTESATPPDEASPSALTATTRREREGVVVLAVPVTPREIVYEPPAELRDANGQPLAPQTRRVNLVELLTALNASPDAVLMLYLEPENAAPFTTTGLSLADVFQFPQFVTTVVTTTLPSTLTSTVPLTPTNGGNR